MARAADRDPVDRGGDVETMLYISQVGEMLGVSTTMIRRWGAMGFVEPGRAPSGFRLYTMSDVDKLRRIRDLARSGLNPEGIRRALMQDAGEGTAGMSNIDQTAVGSRLHRLRRSSGKSLRRLAEEADLSASHLSSIERCLNHPSVAVLQRIAAALGTNMIDILGGDVQRNQLVVRTDDRRPLDGYLNGVEIQQLYRVETALESLLFIVQPGASSGETYCHPGEEFLFILEGEFQIVLDGTEQHVMKVGDSMTFASHRPHSFHNPGTETAKVLWINTPPTF